MFESSRENFGIQLVLNTRRDISCILHIHRLFSNSTIVGKRFFNRVSKVISRLIWFSIAALYDWLKNLTPLSQAIKGKTNINRDLLARVFPRLALSTCVCF